MQIRKTNKTLKLSLNLFAHYNVIRFQLRVDISEEKSKSASEEVGNQPGWPPKPVPRNGANIPGIHLWRRAHLFTLHYRNDKALSDW